MARRRPVRRRHPDHPQAAPALGRPDPREPGLFASARPRRRRSSSPRSRDGTGLRRLAQAARARERRAQRRPAAGRAQDGHRLGQDRRDGDAHRLADAQQACSPATTPASPTGSSSSRPGITIRDRLRVLLPADPRTTTTCATWSRPTSGRPRQARDRRSPTSTPSCSRTPRRSRASPTNTRLLLQGRPQATTRSRRRRRPMVEPGLRDLGPEQAARSSSSTTRPTTATGTSPLQAGEKARAKEQKRARTRRPASGSPACRRSHKQVGIKAVYDLSATPFYLSGSGYTEGYIFPWMVSDFSLMDAIESGIVKVPRIAGRRRRRPTTLVTYLRSVGLRRRRAARSAPAEATRSPTGSRPRSSRARCAASTAATRRRSRTGRRSSAQHGETPPVFIVVCPNTTVSKLVYDWIAGEQIVERRRRSSRTGPASSPLLQQRRRRRAARAAAHDPGRLGAARVRRGDEGRLQEGRRRRDRGVQGASTASATPAPTSTKLTDEDLLREVMNTVGKTGPARRAASAASSPSRCSPRAGTPTPSPTSSASARSAASCCASRWSAAGCAAARYAVNDDGCFEPEYAERLRHPVPVHLHRQADRRPAAAQARRSRCERSRAASDLRITFPKLDGYRVELPDERHLASTSTTRREFEIGPNTVPTLGRDGRRRRRARARGAATRLRTAPQQVAFALAKRILESTSTTATTSGPGSSRSWSRSARTGSSRVVVLKDGYSLGLPHDDHRGASARRRAVWNAITRHGGQPPRAAAPDAQPLRPARLHGRRRLRTPASASSPTEKSEVSHVTLDGKDGNTWEQLLAERARAEHERARRT